MSLARGKYGVEYDPRQLEPEPSGLGWIVVVVLVVAAISLTWTKIRKWSDGAAARPVETSVVLMTTASSNEVKSTSVAVAPSAKGIVKAVDSSRPARARNLLLRLEEAEKRRDVQMAIDTIETLRALPGSPVADLDDALARRLGVLNLQRLFGLRAQDWVKSVEVKRGNSASRIAAEHGSTLASLAKLNGGNVDTIRIGQRLFVMNHPKFSLVVHRRSRTADLTLKEKFFKRYDLQDSPTAKDGAYEVTERRRVFWNSLGIVLRPEDRAELDMLVPNGTPVLVTEI